MFISPLDSCSITCMSNDYLRAPFHPHYPSPTYFSCICYGIVNTSLNLRFARLISPLRGAGVTDVIIIQLLSSFYIHSFKVLYKMGPLDINFRSSAVMYHYSLLQFSPWVSKQSLMHETVAEVCQFLSYKCSGWFKHSLKYMATFSILWLSVTLQCKSALIKHYHLKKNIIKMQEQTTPKLQCSLF